MKFLLDSNVLLRWSDSRADEYAACVEAVGKLARLSNAIYVCAQVTIEFYVVATRPVDVNGLGFSVGEARQILADIEESFPCLPEPPDMGHRWRELVNEYTIIGKQGHDARIAALMLAHGVTHILTLNPQDFARYEGITPVTPGEIVDRAIE